VLGRDADCDVVIRDSRVSGRHAAVRQQGEFWELRDLGSANGIFVNDQMVSRATIRRQDRVRFGSLDVDLQKLLRPTRESELPRFELPRLPSPVLSAPYAPQPAVPSLPPPAAESSLRGNGTVGPVPSSSETTNEKRGGSLWFGFAAILALLLLGSGVLWATRVHVVKLCEVGGEEVFGDYAFPWQETAMREAAEKIRWCPLHANELVAVSHTRKCEYCHKVMDVIQESKPRREEPRDTEEYRGYCSEQCQRSAAAEKIYDDLKSGAKNLLDGVGEGLGAIGEVLRR
jgi:hypothetical protein